MGKKPAKPASKKSVSTFPKPTNPTGDPKLGWISPTAGWLPDLNDWFLEIALHCDRVGEWPHGHRVFAWLYQILGEHTVNMSAFTSQRPDSSCFPWRIKVSNDITSVSFWSELEMPLSQLAEPGAVRALVESLHGMLPTFWGVRGGGSSRHEVWRLEQSWLRVTRNMWAPFSGRVSLRIAFKHLWAGRVVAQEHSERQEASQRPSPPRPVLEQPQLVQSLIEAFFEVASEGVHIQHGYARFRRFKPRKGAFTLNTHAEWLTANLEVAPVAARPRRLVPDFINVLSASDFAQLGSADELRARAAIMLDPKGRSASELKRLISPVGDGIRLQMGDFRAMLHTLPDNPPSDFSFGVPSVRLALWLTIEMGRSGLLVMTTPDPVWHIQATLAQMERNRLEYEQPRQSQRRKPAPSLADSRRQTLKLITSSLPLCVRGNWSRADAQPAADKAGPAAKIIVRPADPTRASTIYASGFKPDRASAGPILVGSLEVERADLAFNPAKHGYDAAFTRDLTEQPEPRRNLTQIVCPKCQGRLFHPEAEFVYPDDLAETVADLLDVPATDISVDGQQLAPRPHPIELFEWFYLRATCAACKHELLVGDCECA